MGLFKKYILLFVALFLIQGTLFAQTTIQTAQSGNIDDCGTYNSDNIRNNGYRLPDFDDIISIQSGHTVTVNTNYNVGQVTFANTTSAVLDFNGSTNSVNFSAISGNGGACPQPTLTCSSGNIEVYGGGETVDQTFTATYTDEGTGNSYTEVTEFSSWNGLTLKRESGTLSSSGTSTITYRLTGTTSNLSWDAARTESVSYNGKKL